MGPKLTELDGHGKIIYAVEVRDVLLSGAVVGVTVSELRSRNPGFKFDWIWSSRQMFIQRWVKPEGANELRALVSEIIRGSKSILSAMATGEILRLKCMTMEGLVPVDPGFIAVSI
jgi:hypothetical protein